MTSLDPPSQFMGGYYSEAPLLKSPFTIFGFDLCKDCQSIFLNPDLPRSRLIDIYRESTSYIKAMEDQSHWADYEERYEMFKRFLPSGRCETLIDAASGFGQIASIAKKDTNVSWQRVAALELSSAYVSNMRSQGIDAYEFDIDKDDISKHFAEASVDFVVFFEAFEHVEFPTKALDKLLWTLRDGGRLFFTAQRYGDDVDLPIRPGEPIYICDKFIHSIEDRLPCKLIDVKTNGSRYFVVLEKDNEAASARKSQPPRTRLRKKFRKEVGNCWIADLDGLAVGGFDDLSVIADNDSDPKRSPLRVVEKTPTQTRLLTQSHCGHAEIRSLGCGRFSHWKGNLYFSTTDNSDPNENGCTYFISL